MLSQSRDTPLMSLIILLCTQILLKLIILFVDRVICKVRKFVVFANGGVVNVGGKAGEAFIVDVETKGFK